MSDETSPPAVNTTLPMGESEAIDVTVTNGSNGQIESRFSSWWALRFKGATAPWSMNFASTVGVSYVLVNDTTGIATLNARASSLGSISLAVGEVALVIALTDPSTNTVEFRKISSNPSASVTFAAVKAALANASSNVGFNGFQVNGLASGSTADAAATAGQTYYLPYTAPAGPGTNVPTIVGSNFLMGGTVAAPEAYEPIFHIWPRDTSYGPYSLSMGTGLSFTTFDATMLFGYNADLIKPAEPSAFVGFENNYEYGAGQRQCEMYFQFGLGGTALVTGGRPLFTVFDRTTARINTSMDFGSDLGTTTTFWTASSRFNGNAITATDTDVFIRRASFGILLNNGAYTAMGFTGAGGINIYDQPAYGSARRFTTGNAKPTVTGNLTAAITVADLKPFIRALLDVLKTSGYDMIVDTTT